MAGAAIACAFVLAACFDLLHSTDDVRTACELDAALAGCPADAAPDAGPAAAGDGNTGEAAVEAGAPPELCASSTAEAAGRAAHVCAWLGACETPMGRNAFGSCFFRALLAYDCAANPDRRPRGSARALWACLLDAGSCAAIDACVFEGSLPPGCGPGVYANCAPDRPKVRAACTRDTDASYPAHGESCALGGQSCVAGAGVCAGGGDPACSNGCEGTSLHWCSAADGGALGDDRGVDCANEGLGACAAFPAAPAARWVACVAESDAGACEPDATASCADGRAIMCPSGVRESLDCAALLGSADACSPGALHPTFDWTSPCSRAPATCPADRCDGGALASCERGADFTVDCHAVGLGDCRLVPTDPGVLRASCTAPAH
jgi:hypothetical protein